MILVKTCMETGLFVIRKGVAQPLALNICIGEANGGIPMSYFSDSIWNQKERSFGSGRAGIWAWFSVFSQCHNYQASHSLANLCQLICISKDECWFCFVQVFLINIAKAAKVIVGKLLCQQRCSFAERAFTHLGSQHEPCLPWQDEPMIRKLAGLALSAKPS